MTQAQIDTIMSTLLAQNGVLRRTQEQQAASNAQIMASMPFLADTMKKSHTTKKFHAIKKFHTNGQSDEDQDEEAGQ